MARLMLFRNLRFLLERALRKNREQIPLFGFVVVSTALVYCL